MTLPPSKFHHILNQAPRSAKHHGKHRGAGAPAYSDPAHGAGDSAGGAEEVITIYMPLRGGTVGGNAEWFSWPDKPKHPAVPHAGIRTGELTGYRFWWVIEEGGEIHLCSLAHRLLWRPGEIVRGDPEELFCPVQSIWGGVYAFKARGQCLGEGIDLMHYLEDCRRDPHGWMGWHGPLEAIALVLGSVKMWGDVVEHDVGYRAEFARLQSLDWIHGAPGCLTALRARYGVAPALL